MRVFRGIIGVLAIMCGIYNIVFPGAGFLSVTWLIAFVLLILGICKIAAYFSARKLGDGDKKLVGGGAFDLIIGILIVIFSIFNLTNELAYASFSLVILIFFIANLFVGGINNIFASFAARRLGSTTWVFALISGILQLMIAIFAICNIFVGVLYIGLLFSIMLITLGVSLLASAFRNDDSNWMDAA